MNNYIGGYPMSVKRKLLPCANNKPLLAYPKPNQRDIMLHAFVPSAL
jgi:hypothetical protein